MNRYIKFLLVFTLAISLAYQSCEENICTEEFVTIGILVIGDTLNEYYTIRNSTLDTIEYSMDYIYGNVYPILNDNYLTEIKNKEETFTFSGKIADSVVVNEVFILGGNNCHVYKVSGVSEVQI